MSPIGDVGHSNWQLYTLCSKVTCLACFAPHVKSGTLLPKVTQHNHALLWLRRHSMARLKGHLCFVSTRLSTHFGASHYRYDSTPAATQMVRAILCRITCTRRAAKCFCSISKVWFGSPNTLYLFRPTIAVAKGRQEIVVPALGPDCLHDFKRRTSDQDGF